MSPDARVQNSGRARALWLDLLAITAGVIAIWCFAATLIDPSGVNVLAFFVGVLPALIGYGLWLHRPWGRSVSIGAGWLAVLMSPIVALGGWIGGQGKDSIGHGLMFVAGIIGMAVLSPLEFILV